MGHSGNRLFPLLRQAWGRARPLALVVLAALALSLVVALAVHPAAPPPGLAQEGATPTETATETETVST